MDTSIIDRLAALERRVALLEIRTSVLRSVDNRRVLEVLGRHIHATGLDDKDLGLVLNQLQQADFIELVKVEGTGGWRITEEGLCAVSEGQ